MWANFFRHTLATSMNLEKDDQKLWRLVKQIWHSESYNTLKENGDMLNGKQAATRLSDNYGMTIWVTSQSIWNTKESLGPDGVTINVGTLEQYAKSWKYITTSCHHVYCYIYDGRQSWYPYIEVTSDKRHTWKPPITHVDGKARQKLTIIRKLAGPISGDW